MESWREVLRNGVMPSLPADGLVALKDALESDDMRLVQGATVVPPPLMCVKDWDVDGCCAIAFVGWQDGTGRKTVEQVEEFFARCCYEADKRLGEAAAVRWFLNWADDTPRDEMRRELLAEVELELYGRDVAPSYAVEHDPELIEQLPF